MFDMIKIMTNKQNISIKKTLNTIIFKSDTPLGLLFDILLIATILISILVVLLESIDSINFVYKTPLKIAELTFTGLFSIEYLLRLYCAKSAKKYTKSFFGVVDLLSILPTFIGFILTGTNFLSVIRILRVLRIFRLLKLVQYVSEIEIIIHALKNSSKKLIVFLFMVVSIVTILGSFIYIIEGEKSGFTNIPISIYWAIVTLTTVGYGDLSPQTPLGKIVASMIMILGYCIIAVPTGLVSIDIAESLKKNKKQ